VGIVGDMEEHELVEAAEELAASLTPRDLDNTLSRVTSAAVEALPDVDYASITIRHEHGPLETVAPTDPTLCEIDRAQYELQEGPCYDAATDVHYISAPDLAADARYPRFAEVALAAGIRSQVGVRLFDAPTSKAGLNLYSRRVGAFADFESVAALFARQSATVIEYARELQALHEAAHTRDLVGRAVGIAIERYGLPDHRAFALLTRLSHHHHVALPVVAQAIVSASEGRADD
jgi:GAF domain-containing protein